MVLAISISVRLRMRSILIVNIINVNIKAFTEFQIELNLYSAMIVDSEVGYVDEILYAADSTLHDRQYAYHGTNHVQPIIVERFFSMCKRTMSDLMKNLGPESLEEKSVILRIYKDCGYRTPRN